MESNENIVIKEGWLKKKTTRGTTWGERFFSLKGSSLYYYFKSIDVEPKGVFHLNSTCKISEISSDLYKLKKYYIFKLTFPTSEDDTEDKDSQKKKSSKKKDDKKQIGNNNVDSGKVAALAVGGVVVGALTAGIGLLAGMMVVGLGAAAGGSVALSNNSSDKERVLTLASESLQEIESWVQIIQTKLRELSSSNNQNIPLHISQVSEKHAPPPGVRFEEVEEWIKSNKWKLSCIEQGIRLFELSPPPGNKSINDPPCLKVNIGMYGTATDIFMAIMNLPPLCRTGIIQKLRIVETIDNYTDIVNISFEPIYIHPTWTSPRDLCLMRYWRHNSDGSYVICLDSTVHSDCPLTPGYVRAEMHGVYAIIPPKEGEVDEDHMECLVSFIAQFSPKGWIWSKFAYQKHFLQKYMVHMVDIRDALDAERFVHIQFDVNSDKTNTSNALITDQVDAAPNPEKGSIGTLPPPYLQPSMWAESDASGFKVRGKSYCHDKVKTSSATSLFKLIAIDLFEVPEGTPNICAHPRNRVFQALQRGEEDWVFVVNIMVPGPPYLSFVAYFKGDKSIIESDTPFGRIAKPFFYGNDDEFRNNRFKLIPRVLDGNMIIKMAVKDTPTLIGNKLKQYYFKGDNYFEIDIDVGSSSVARNVVGLAIGYSKNIVVDIGFCLQGNEEHELPEVLMGGCTCVHIDTSTAKKL